MPSRRSPARTTRLPSSLPRTIVSSSVVTSPRRTTKSRLIFARSPCGVLRLAVICHQRHRLVAAADPVHRRPEAREEIHQRLQQATRPGHYHELCLVLVDRATDGPGDLLGGDHERRVRLQAELVDGALADAGILDGAEDDGGGGDPGSAVVVAKDATEGDESVLARRVGLHMREPDAAGDRGEVHDPAVATLEHPRKQKM